MSRVLMIVEALSVVGGTLSALAGEIDTAILLWLVAIFLAVKQND